MPILITGGAGYIGGITASYFIEKGEKVIILDNLSKSKLSAVPAGCIFYQGDTDNTELIEKIVAECNISECLHFASFIEVGESVKDPYKYFKNNTSSSLVLFNTLKKCGVERYIFSSTAAVYGEPEYVPINEEHPKNPTNPYGLSKLFVEKILESFAVSAGVKYVALRYFNACGAAFGRGEDHNPETHLIPLVLQTALGKRDKILIFGDDYPTPDGTCVRDYIHVLDLASAHWKALEYLRNGGDSVAINLGNGNGFSVKEVIDMAGKVVGRPINFAVAERRAGDPSFLVASSDKAKKVLGWSEEHASLEDMISSAWEWHRNNPNGY